MSTCVNIRDLAGHEGHEVDIRGWLYGKRSGGKVVFLLVRDGTGMCQCVVEARQPDAFESASALTQDTRRERSRRQPNSLP